MSRTGYLLKGGYSRPVEECPLRYLGELDTADVAQQQMQQLVVTE